MRVRLRTLAAVPIALLAASALVLWLRSRPSEIRRESGLDVLLITVDTLRADALGVYGQARDTSPVIDRLARAGVRFATARAHHTVTLPAHADLLSGRYPFQHGVRDNAGFRMPEGLDTLPVILKRSGYRTAAFVSGFPLDSRFGLARGFDVYEDAFVAGARTEDLVLPERRASATVPLARSWLADAQGKPSFCWVHLYDPHAPYDPPEPFASRFGSERYLGEVAAVDDALGALLRPLLDAANQGRTLVVLTADHGESLGEHGELTHGLYAYEATLRVPLILYAPRLFAPRVVSEPVRHVDVLPTVLDALGLPLPQGLSGRSLLGLAAGRGAPQADCYFEALSANLGRGWAPLRGIVRGERKYVDLPIPELYDLKDDPKELRNLASSRELLEPLRVALGELLEPDRGPAPHEESAETRQRLAALGYVGGATSSKEHYGEEDDPKRLVALDEKMQRALGRLRVGDLEGSRALSEEVVRQRPNMGSALLVLGVVERKLGRPDEAIAHLQRALAANPEDVSTLVTLAATLGETGQGPRAIELLAPYAAREQPAVDVLVTLGMSFARLGRSAEALEAFSRARALDASDPFLLVQIATVQIGSGDRAGARQSLDDALRLRPDLGIAHHHLGLLALMAENAAEAERCFRRAIELDPGDADSLLNLGLLLARGGRTVEARPLLESFLRVAPTAIYRVRIEEVRGWLRRNAAGAP